MKKTVCSLVAMFTLIIAGCGLQPPTTFIKTFDTSSNWRSIEVREELERAQIWTIMVDTLSQTYDLEVINDSAGYIRTSWKYTYIKNGNVISNYRSRIVVKAVDNWAQVQVKCESNWLSEEGWEVGYDSRLLEDAYGDLQGKIGRVRR